MQANTETFKCCALQHFMQSSGQRKKKEKIISLHSYSKEE